jgi:hypothetical protein
LTWRSIRLSRHADKNDLSVNVGNVQVHVVVAVNEDDNDHVNVNVND